MKNFIQPGDTLTLAAPYNVTSGGGVLVGAIFGIACNDALAGTEMEAKLTGVFSMQKVATESWSLGGLVYWNDIDKLVTSVAGNHQLIGVTIAAAVSPSSVGLIRLNGIFIKTEALVYNERSGVFNSPMPNK